MVFLWSHSNPKHTLHIYKAIPYLTIMKGVLFTSLELWFWMASKTAAGCDPVMVNDLFLTFLPDLGPPKG